MSATTKIGYAISTRGGMKSYRARAYVLDRGVKHTFIVAIGDTPEEAKADALRYVRDRHHADNLPAPDAIDDVGRVNGALLDAWLF